MENLNSSRSGVGLPQATRWFDWIPVLLLAAVLAGSVAPVATAATLLDDRQIRIQSPADASRLRRALIDYVWGPAGFPYRRLPDSLRTNIPSPVRDLKSLARVDELRVEMWPGLQGLAWHFIPANPNQELVVVHHGHACTLDDDSGPADVGYGLQRTIAALLREGYGVLGVFMPHMRPGDCTGGHAEMFQIKTSGSPMKFFLEPVAAGLNHVTTSARVLGTPVYEKFHMTGLSGGGWTTTVYAALDPRILVSVPVAGTIPLHLRTGGSVGDLEQFEPGFYSIASYQDLYILGADSGSRRQVQVLVRRDDCCFGEAQHDSARAGAGYEDSMRGYERRVREKLLKFRSGGFKLEIDETAPSHMISHHAIERILLPALRERPR